MRLTVAGGDMRMITVAERFTEIGYKCFIFGFDKHTKGEHGIEYTEDIADAISKSSAVILPFPCEKDGFLNMPFSGRKTELSGIFSLGNEETIFIGGKLPRKEKRFIDYSQNEDFLLRNAVATAEGAVETAMSLMKTTINGAEITVAGYGRIGSYLATILRHLGANVTIIARSASRRTLASISGVDAVGFEDFEAPLSRADIVFNTVPFKVIGESELKSIKTGTAIIDLASLPGGADEKECERFGITLIRALGLPGKTAPVSAGEAIFHTVLPILKDRGIKT